MRLGIFGGTFDPVHNEHVALAESAVKCLHLDKLLVMPAHVPPHKKNKILSSDEDRLEMCRLAFSFIPEVEVSDYEIRQGGTSYSYLTCRHFRTECDELFFLVGTDMLRDFPTWKNPEDILENATLAVCGRAEQSGWQEKEQEIFKGKFHKNFAVISYEGKAVSSTRTRVLLGAEEDVSAFIPTAVEKYVTEKKLYAVENAKKALSEEKTSRKEHSIRVAFWMAEHAQKFKVDEKKAVVAGLFHDCAKNLSLSDERFKNFTVPDNVPEPVMHQYMGAYLAETEYGIQDEDILNAIRYHTSGRANMSPLEKLTFVGDMVEEGRTYPGVEEIRQNAERDLDDGFLFAIKQTLDFLSIKGGEVYPLTQIAYDYAWQEKKGE